MVLQMIVAETLLFSASNEILHGNKSTYILDPEQTSFQQVILFSSALCHP